MREFRVRDIGHARWEVLEYESTYHADLRKNGTTCYAGSLADCYAYIMLRDRGAL